MTRRPTPAQDDTRPSTGQTPPRAHRALVAVIASATLLIAGIGFAGSYAAVRELALKKGFGNFSYVFPIGIDAGICVLLALDLLLTWIRIPFPLLRQTAWLLTAATIAFNGAAAWPDPLGVGMHSVIPILFVVAVEAARHAVGRIADITADKHMEGVRLTRWMLSPVPTFLLWRRMKLWELRSYEQVIKLEQERLVYQARLRSRFGRSWRRKAPVESLMPLRLARYGVPLAETAPAGLAAAGIHPIPHPPPAEHKQLAGEPGSDPSRARPPHIPHRDSHNGQASASEQSRPATPDVQLSLNGSSTGGRSVPHQATRHANYSAFNDATAAPVQPHASGARWQPRHAPLKHTPTPATDPGSPASLAHRRPPRERAQSSAPQPRTASDETVSGRGQDDRSVGGPSLDTNGEGQVPDVRYGAASIEGPHTNSPQRQRPSHATTSDRPPAADSTQHAAPEPDTQTLALSTNADEPAHSELTQVDRYYQAWHTHQVQHGQEPTPEQLSTALTHQGIRTRQGQSVTPKALARYYLQFRLYTAWAQHRAHTSYPAIHHVLKYLTRRGITAQYNKPLTPADLAPRLDAFERRWHTLNHH